MSGLDVKACEFPGEPPRMPPAAGVRPTMVPLPVEPVKSGMNVGGLNWPEVKNGSLLCDAWSVWMLKLKSTPMRSENDGAMLMRRTERVSSRAYKRRRGG